MTLADLAVPIVGAPMAGATTPALVAEVSEAGGLGCLPLGWLQPAEIAVAFAAVRALTARPFAANVFVDTAPPYDRERVRAARDALQPFRDELGLRELVDSPENERISFAAQLEATFAAQPAVLTFTFGIPAASILARARADGIYTIATAKTVDEALALEAAGVDAVCAQGHEAGGHHGPFLGTVDADIGSLALVASVVRALRIPVVAAGGIGDGRGLAAVLALGASAAQIGSAFLLASESGISPAYRAALAHPSARETHLTTTFSGRTARGIRNRFSSDANLARTAAPYPDQHMLTRDLRAAAAKAGNAELLSLWAGQAVSLARPEPARVIVARLMHEAGAALIVAQRALRGFEGREAYAQVPMESSTANEPATPDVESIGGEAGAP